MSNPIDAGAQVCVVPEAFTASSAPLVLTMRLELQADTIRFGCEEAVVLSELLLELAGADITDTFVFFTLLGGPATSPNAGIDLQVIVQSREHGTALH